MERVKTALRQVIVINKIVTIRYYEYMKNFIFPGEDHDFWEFVCVDKGEIYAKADEKQYLLKKGDIIFHKPNEFHAIYSPGDRSPNLIILSFECKSPAAKFFENKILTIDSEARTLLSLIILEARSAFPESIHIPTVNPLKRAPSSAFGSEQLIKLYLEHFLIHLIRVSEKSGLAVTKKSIPFLPMEQDSIIGQVIHYLSLHICEPLTVRDICEGTLIGRSQLQSLFHKEKKCGVIYYFHWMKVNLAKEIIRDRRMNFSEISDYLSYSSPQYFSKQFKEFTKMSPSEYASSVIRLTDHASKIHSGQ